ncbi:MAG: hypothetical protein ACXWL2_05330 [Candidatus Chromulinivorax sp.]
MRKFKLTLTVLIVTMISISATAAVFYVIHPKCKQPVSSIQDVRGVQSDGISNRKGEILQNADDLCGGTGGTGRIINVGSNGITIKRNDSTIQTIKFTNRTKIKTSEGAISKADLKVGERVTLVIDKTETAALVLVCNISHFKTQSGK